MDIYELIKNFETPILVFDKQGSLLYKNTGFDKLFEEYGDVEDFSKKLHKFKNSFNIQSCMLNSEDITEFNPIDIALKTKEGIKTFATYQKTREDFLSLFISLILFNYNKHSILKFLLFIH